MPSGAAYKFYDHGGRVQIGQLQHLANRESHDAHTSPQVTEGFLNLPISYAAWDGETTRVLQLGWCLAPQLHCRPLQWELVKVSHALLSWK